jgi:hypothetical protein
MTADLIDDDEVRGAVLDRTLGSFAQRLDARDGGRGRRNEVPA